MLEKDSDRKLHILESQFGLSFLNYRRNIVVQHGVFVEDDLISLYIRDYSKKDKKNTTILCFFVIIRTENAFNIIVSFCE